MSRTLSTKKGSVESLTSSGDAAVRRRPERPGARWISRAGWRRRPAGRSSGLRRRPGLQCAPQQRGCLLIRQRARTKLVIEALDTALDKPLPPLADRGLGPVQLLGNPGVGPPFRRPQHQPGTRHQRMRKTAGTGKSGQLLLLFRRHFQCGFRTSQRHIQAWPHRNLMASCFRDTTLGCMDILGEPR
jgi:hypothetical protein